MKRRIYSAEDLTKMYFYKQDGFPPSKIVTMMDATLPSISPTIIRLERHLNDDTTSPNPQTKKALAIIRERLAHRSRALNLSDVKTKLFEELGTFIDALVEDCIKERYVELVGENAKFKAANTRLELKLNNRKIMHQAYEDGLPSIE